MSRAFVKDPGRRGSLPALPDGRSRPIRTTSRRRALPPSRRSPPQPRDFAAAQASEEKDDVVAVRARLALLDGAARLGPGDRASARPETVHFGSTVHDRRGATGAARPSASSARTRPIPPRDRSPMSSPLARALAGRAAGETAEIGERGGRDRGDSVAGQRAGPACRPAQRSCSPLQPSHAPVERGSPLALAAEEDVERLAEQRLLRRTVAKSVIDERNFMVSGSPNMPSTGTPA